ncbi:MAG: 2Fe-2S iron-sulfur cluster-binding protein, partial [Chloroflexi bacterium]|nr:2Fe-2S iron-sulfur cluster-binding protein [Chloroflexota bacterium]
MNYDGRILDSLVGKSIFDYADALSVRVPTSCGRTGECHECIVEIKRGMDALSPHTEAEAFLREDYRLACQAAIVDANEEVEFAVLRRQPRILTRSVRRAIEIEPVTRRIGDGVFFRETRIDDYRGQMFGIAIDVGTTTVV